MALILSASQTPGANAAASRIVSHTAITLTAPVAGATPATTASDNSGTPQFTGTVTWSTTSAIFDTSTSYTATIILTPIQSPVWSWPVSPVSVGPFTLSGATSISNDQPSPSGQTVTVRAIFPATGATVDLLNLNTGFLPAPVNGAVPTTSITRSQYTGSVAWTNVDTGSTTDTFFAPNTLYSAVLTLTSSASRTFYGVGENTFNVASAATTLNPAGTGSTLQVTVTFLRTAAVDITIVKRTIGTTITPVTGATPLTSTVSNGNYRTTIVWYGSPTTFAPDTAYTATITVVPDTGYTVTGVGANFFNVTGATSATNPSDSGAITAVFPATGHRITLNYVLGAPNATVNTFGKTQWDVGVTSPLTPPTPSLTNGSDKVVTFKGWKDSVTGNVTASGSSWSPSPTETASSQTITMTAQWGFDVTYSYRFYDATTSTDTTISATSGGVWPTAPNPSRAGYTLIGWKTLSGTPVARGGFPFKWLAQQTGADSLVADWKPNVYQMVFNQSNGGTYTSNNGVQVVTAGANTIYPPSMSKVGYTLDGWYDSYGVKATSGYIPSDNKCNMYYASPCQVFFHAVWTSKTTTITFNANTGGGSAPNNVTYTSGTPVSLPSNTFTPPAGKTFVGWSLSNNGVQISSYNTPTDSASVTIYAIWSGSAQYVVTFDSALGSAVSPVTVSSGSALTLPTPTRTGYGFAGWYTNFGLGSRVGTAGSYASYSPTSSTTIYARWFPSVYTLFFQNTGATNGGANAAGNAPTFQYYIFGQNLTLPGAGTLSLAGRTFQGWSLTARQSSTSTKITTFNQSTITDNHINGSNIYLYPIWG